MKGCAVCGGSIRSRSGPGRPALYCSTECRLARYRAGAAVARAETGRNAALVEAILSGRTAADVAREHGISRERARQIFTRATGAPVPPQGWRCSMCRSRVIGDQIAHRKEPAHLATLATRRERRRAASIARFWALVDSNGPIPEFAPGLGPCWIWTGASDEMQPGKFYPRSTMSVERFAHRLAYILTRGPIPAGMELDHLCRVTTCVNPSHLEAVTHRENVRRGLNGVLRYLRAIPWRTGPRSAGGRLVRVPRQPRPGSFCRNGHELVAANLFPSGNCRPCNQAAVRRYQERKRAAA